MRLYLCFGNAARTISSLGKSVAEMAEKAEDLSEMPCIGEDLAGKIKEILKAGSLAQLVEVEEETPAELSKLMKIPGHGAGPLLLDEHGVFRAATGGLPDLPLQFVRDGVDGDRRPFASFLKTKDLGACLHTPSNRPAFKLIDLGSHKSLQNDFCLKWHITFVRIASFRS